MNLGERKQNLAAEIKGIYPLYHIRMSLQSQINLSAQIAQENKSALAVINVNTFKDAVYNRTKVESPSAYNNLNKIYS